MDWACPALAQQQPNDPSRTSPLRQRPWHSMVRRKRYPHRLRLDSTGLPMPRARRDARAASPQREPQRIPRSQASTSEVPGTDQSRGLDGYTCRNRPSFSSSLHGCGRCIRPKDEKDKAPLSSRSCGRSLASLYDGRRPHFALDRRTPDQAYYASLPLTPVGVPLNDAGILFKEPEPPLGMAGGEVMGSESRWLRVTVACGSGCT